VSGSHTLRVWYAGPDRLRVALLGQLGESDLIRNGPDLWACPARTTRHPLVGATAGAEQAPAPGVGTSMTPQQAAQAALKAIDPSTRV